MEACFKILDSFEASIMIGVSGTIERYKKAFSDSSNTPTVAETSTQFYQQEASKLRRQIRDIQASNRHITGEALTSLSFKDLKNLEGRLEKGISRIRAKKNEALITEIEFMQQREIELQNHNSYLRAKISEKEGAEEEEQSNMMVGGGVYQNLPNYLLDVNPHYPPQDHFCLQL